MFRPHRDTAPDNEAIYTSIGHLQVVGNHPDTARVIYLGYPLQLSPEECRLLLGILSALGEGRDGVDSETLYRTLSDDRSDPSTVSKVSVYLGRINDKAADISGRKLILHDRHRGYRLNPYM